MVIHGWTVYGHPAFVDASETLVAEVAALQAAEPTTYRQSKEAKRLFAIYKLAFDTIPQDPTDPKYRLGKTLGESHKHWFRAKFYQQYRLFFRFNLQTKIIILGWVNDDDTLRAYGSKTDAYAVFGKRLKAGTPPDDWDSLLAAARDASDRFNALAPPAPPQRE